MPQPAVRRQLVRHFRAQQGQILQGREKDFPENAPVRGLATVYIRPGTILSLKFTVSKLAGKSDDYGCGTGRADWNISRKRKKNCWTKLPASRSSPTGRHTIGSAVTYYQSFTETVLS